MAYKCLVKTDNSKMVSKVPFSVPHIIHTKQLNTWPTLSASCMVIFSWLSACSREMKPFEGN